MADQHGDDFERRLAERLRSHASRALGKVDARALVRHLGESPPARRMARRWAAAVVAATVLLASVVTVSALQLIPGGASPTPAPSALSTPVAATPVPPTPVPSAPPSSPTPPSASWQMTALAFWPTGEVGLAGGGTGASGRVDRTTDGGRTWTTVWRPATPVVQLAAGGSADAWALTCADGAQNCTTWHSSDRGLHWSRIGTTATSISFADAQHGWALAPSTAPPSQLTGGPGLAEIERTADGGRTWQPVATSPCGPGKQSPMGPTAIAAASATSAWLLCTGGPATIMEDKTIAVTTDSGASWQLRAVVAGGDPSLDVGQIPISGHPSGLAVAPDGTAWLWGDRMRPLLSRDGGRTWTDMALGQVDGSPVTAAVPLDAQHGLALLWDPNQQATLLEATDDGGQTWSTRYAWPVSSPSPSTWTSLRWPQPSALSGGVYPMDIVTWHGEYVAVGQATSDGGQPGGGAMISSDGVHWTRVDTGGAFPDIPIRLAATEQYLIAVGNLQRSGTECQPPAPSASAAPPVWVSTDARTWTQIDPRVFGAGYFAGLQAGPHGALIEGSTATGQPALWFSPDGARWQRVDLPTGLDHATLTGGAATADGLVVVGRLNQPGPAGQGHESGYGLPAAWWSTDGLTWQTSTVDSTVSAPGAELGPVEAGAKGLFALGSDSPDPTTPTAAPAWASHDAGRSWQRVGQVAGSVPYGTQTASDGTHIVVLGPVPTSGAENWDSLAAWVSTDGVTWRRLTLLGAPANMPVGGSGPGSQKAQMSAVWTVGNGLIVIGSEGKTTLDWFVTPSG